MNPRQLYDDQRRPVDAWQCGVCQDVFRTRETADRCCRCRLCYDLPRRDGHSTCGQCNTPCPCPRCVAFRDRPDNASLWRMAEAASKEVATWSDAKLRAADAALVTRLATESFAIAESSDVPAWHTALDHMEGPDAE